jgi:BMFP domain-containing protein YqiC|tara:strand:+ start:1716 stop:1955 length:240 start_codon:yes stop_codon:yes gene_type:complete
MAKKKTFMNRMNLLNEGFFDALKKIIAKGRLKKNKKLNSLIKGLNKDTQEFEDLYNHLMKQQNPKHKNIKLSKRTIDDF